MRWTSFIARSQRNLQGLHKAAILVAAEESQLKSNLSPSTWYATRIVCNSLAISPHKKSPLIARSYGSTWIGRASPPNLASSKHQKDVHRQGPVEAWGAIGGASCDQDNRYLLRSGRALRGLPRGWIRYPARTRPSEACLCHASSSGCLRPVMYTRAPFFTKTLAVARPIPEFPPVITAIFPSSFGIFSSVMSVEPRSFPGRSAFGLAPRLIYATRLPYVCVFEHHERFPQKRGAKPEYGFSGTIIGGCR
jgi:hypothetical protein